VAGDELNCLSGVGLLNRKVSLILYISAGRVSPYRGQLIFTPRFADVAPDTPTGRVSISHRANRFPNVLHEHQRCGGCLLKFKGSNRSVNSTACGARHPGFLKTEGFKVALTYIS